MVPIAPLCTCCTRAWQCAETIYHAEMNLGGLTPRQLAVLVTVAQHRGVNQTGPVDRTTVGEMVRR